MMAVKFFKSFFDTRVSAEIIHWLYFLVDKLKGLAEFQFCLVSHQRSLSLVDIMAWWGCSGSTRGSSWPPALQQHHTSYLSAALHSYFTLPSHPVWWGKLHLCYEQGFRFWKCSVENFMSGRLWHVIMTSVSELLLPYHTGFTDGAQDHLISVIFVCFAFLSQNIICLACVLCALMFTF